MKNKLKKKLIEFSSAYGISLPSSCSPDFVTGLHWARDALQKHLNAKYAVTDPQGIEKLERVKIGGINQWLHIRGRSRSNPILLYIHGGPGSSNIGVMDAIQRPWEDYFTVVQWDQRYAGKSYDPDNKGRPLSMQIMIEDTEEVIRLLLRNSDQKKIFILGHSWGSVLGMQMVKRKPNWLYAYIGIGQIVSMMDGEQLIYKRVLRHAQLQQDKVFAILKAIRTYPDIKCPERSFLNNALHIRKELSRLGREVMMRNLPFDEVITMLGFDRLISPHLTLTDIVRCLCADETTSPHNANGFIKEYLSIDLPKDIGSSFDVPVFFFTGKHDWQTPRYLSDGWFGDIHAPHKELVHFENSSHSVVNEEPGKLLFALVSKVLPFAQGGFNQDSHNE